MRTTIRLDEQLLAAANAAARESGRTLTTFVEKALRQALARRRSTAERRGVEICTVAGSGLLPNVDVDDSAALLELLA